MSAANVTFETADWEPAAPGAEANFSFDCPTHRGRRCELLSIRGRGDNGSPSWEWNGNRDAPTFQPSINHTGCWHGYIADGRCVKADQKTDEPEPTS